MNKGHVVGVDIGTSRCRAVLYETTGRLVAESTRSYSILNPKPGWQEQDPEAVLNAFLACLGEIIERAGPNALLGIGLSCYFHSFMAVDQNNRPLTPCIIWTDTRSRGAARRIAEECDPQSLYRRTGCPLHPMYPICKARWLSDEAPSILLQAHKIVSVKEYIAREVFGEYLVDWSVASGSGMLNIHTLDWDEEAVELAGLRADHLSTVTSTLTRLPRIRSRYAGMLRLKESVPVIIGGADGTLSSIGVGAVGPGEADSMAGTGAAVRVLVPEPRLDEKARTWCYVAAPNRWAVGGVSAAGLIYEWFIREFETAERQEAERRGMNLHQLLDEYVRSV
ncbi:MAG: gluconokinase, partial [Deltaproteobacteria bacterium]|nr:gluconokinase [Deltaproteobacteria bacterium]